MSAYTTYTDVQNYFMGLDFTDSDYLKDATVATWIDEFSTKIDITIGRRYSLPISNSIDLVYLKQLCERLVVGQIDDLLRNNSDLEVNKKEFLRKRNYTKKAESELERLFSGMIQLNSSPKSLRPIRYKRGS